ncbi:putative MFS transporter [Talaromyces proteolyticus]|uniref:MFS transporter n=1 Tax=Talaromyces proteolyticus TaxID=1131652 RepID=A0AAD4KEM2_9EURO|nr:putative MFS transporter [Talaromyces proteolyticus]KAH8690509.1 putative MFS transporter [Talaromyces proteolyticus]
MAPSWDNRSKWTIGILSDPQTDEVPGTVLLLASNRNEPLGLRNQPARTSASSLPSQFPPSRSSSRSVAPVPKKTSDGRILLEPQPEDTLNDPLNWPAWRRDTALLSLGFYCLMGGGMTPVLAAGFNEVAKDYNITTQQVAYTTGLYMLGLGLGSVVMAPTAILYGKRPVYLLGATLFIISGIWCALSPNYVSLVLARIFMGFAVSPVECLPSATIAEIFFLHERAYRIGIYTLLLLGGKNLIPLVSAAIIGRYGWRWVFWVVAIIVGGALALLFFFVPETFWDRTPRPKSRSKRPNIYRSVSDFAHLGFRGRRPEPRLSEKQPSLPRSNDAYGPTEENGHRKRKEMHVGFAEDQLDEKLQSPADLKNEHPFTANDTPTVVVNEPDATPEASHHSPTEDTDAHPAPLSPVHLGDNRLSLDPNTDYFNSSNGSQPVSPTRDIEGARRTSLSPLPMNASALYTHNLRERPPVSYVHMLRPWNGRLAHDKWHRVLVRPFILFAYPAVLWSALVYSLSIGWLIVLSESVAHIYQGSQNYNFSALATGLVYISPFVGGIIGTAVAGRVSDIIVRYMTRLNGGIYEPEFRLVMAIPVALSTAAGLMGFGWSAQEKDNWIVPTIFFGIISFGCALGSTTSITFCVDSYRQYAGEALVTLNFSKNIFHGLVFSLFFVDWLESDGARNVFIAIGGIQLACLLTAIPMYIFGKRARMWTVRKKLMEKF